MERISGPFNGFYIATYASITGGPGSSYLGYSKICRGKPDNYWTAHCCATVAGEEIHTTPHAAMNEAERRARNQTGELAPFAFARQSAGRQRIVARR
jgi:hypothetical protein